jgi:hypothetical protein
VFWKPVYYLLEDDVECWLLNAQHLKNVPGRKTEVADAAWIANWSSMVWSARAWCRPARSGSCGS